MMDPAIDEPVAPRTPNKPLFPVTPDPLDARLAALEAVAEAAEDVSYRIRDGLPRELRGHLEWTAGDVLAALDAALARLRAIEVMAQAVLDRLSPVGYHECLICGRAGYSWQDIHHAPDCPVPGLRAALAEPPA